MEMVRELSSWLLLCSGAALCIVGGIGLLRLPDVYSRMHGAGIIDTGGTALILIHFGLQRGFLPREKLALAALIVGPAFIPTVAQATGVQIGFLLLLLSLWSCQRRIAAERPMTQLLVH